MRLSKGDCVRLVGDTSGATARVLSVSRDGVAAFVSWARSWGGMYWIRLGALERA